MSDYTPDEATVKATWTEFFYLQSHGMKHVDDSGTEFDRFVADVKADAWDEGLQAGWEECQNPGPFVNDWWDSKAPNPHRIEGEA